MKDTKTDRDASVDRMLTATLKARTDAAPGGACLDAETVAAWADQGLDRRERALAEAHAADCGRCQALLAAMVRTQAAVPEATPAAAWWRMPALGWLVPLTVAATALVIWVAVPNRAPVPVSDGGAEAVDQVRAAREPIAPPAAASRPDAPAEVKEKAADVPPPISSRERQESPALEQQSAQAPQAVRAPSAEPMAIAPPASPAADANSLRSAPAELRAFGAAARMSTSANAIETVIVSSNPATRFRLLPGGGVQRSADAGATWRTEITGAADTLTAGASPSPSVCWLVGPAGAVFLSTDGRSWRRLAVPEAEDLRTVTATDNENATVTTVSGHTFVTTDGGQTWVRPPDI